jgi:hypothetical protein
MDRRSPVAFVADPETLPSLPASAAVLPLRPEVEVQESRRVASRPEDLLGQADQQRVEQDSDRVLERLFQEVDPDPFSWNGVNLAECFVGSLELVVRDLMKSAVVIERVLERLEPPTLITDVDPLQSPFPGYPYLSAIGSLIETISAEQGRPYRLLSAQPRTQMREAPRSALVQAYVRLSSRKALAVLQGGGSLVALGPYPEQFVPIARAWQADSRATVVVSTARAPVRSAPRSHLFAATLESFVDSVGQEKVARFTRQAVSTIHSMSIPTALRASWPVIWGPLRTEIRTLMASELPNLAAAGIAFEDRLGNASGLVLLETSSPLAKSAIRFARKRAIPVTVIQHGIVAGAWSYSKTEADRLAAWGPTDAKWFEVTLGPKVRVQPTGSPRYDQLATTSPSEKDAFVLRLPAHTTVVTFASQPFVQDRALRSPWERQLAIDMAVRVTEELRTFALVVKWHPAEKPSFLGVKEGSSAQVWSTQSANTFALVRRSTAVLAISSTVSLEAMYLDRPVVFLGPPDLTSPFHPPEDGGGLRANTEMELVGCLRRLLHDEPFRDRVLVGQREFLAENYAPLDGRAAERVAHLLLRG